MFHIESMFHGAFKVGAFKVGGKYVPWWGVGVRLRVRVRVKGVVGSRGS